MGPVPHEDALQRWLIEWHKMPAGQEGPPILQALVAAPVQELESASQETFWQCSFAHCNQGDNRMAKPNSDEWAVKYRDTDYKGQILDE